ncbi:hypothetical protein [Mucilaginibacter ginsenosidivorax]|uniref:hypothetical protein n=1 Tax=Mucilaginibacter ginsenosidivorax TaxID=862126 RepID=UPI0013156897|nr:hypothetical protein [Mucilaginibacter ginsenosidivorax]
MIIKGKTIYFLRERLQSVDKKLFAAGGYAKQCKLLKTIFNLNVLYSALSYICASIIN